MVCTSNKCCFIWLCDASTIRLVYNAIGTQNRVFCVIETGSRDANRTWLTAHMVVFGCATSKPGHSGAHLLPTTSSLVRKGQDIGGTWDIVWRAVFAPIFFWEVHYSG